jgi:magnesium chelatase family protein
MLARVFSAAIQGVEAIQVEIEVNAGSGDPAIVLVGLPDAAVRESKDRVTTAIANSGFRWPRSRTTVNLAPADLKKEGPSFDLPIAVGMIAVAEGADMPRLGRCLMAASFRSMEKFVRSRESCPLRSKRGVGERRRSLCRRQTCAKPP